MKDRSIPIYKSTIDSLIRSMNDVQIESFRYIGYEQSRDKDPLTDSFTLRTKLYDLKKKIDTILSDGIIDPIIVSRLFQRDDNTFNISYTKYGKLNYNSELRIYFAERIETKNNITYTIKLTNEKK